MEHKQNNVNKENGEKKVYPGHSDIGHPEIFNTVPKIKYPLKPGQLTEEQLNQFFREGYLIIEDFFKKEELDPAKDAIEKLVEGLAAKLFRAGKVRSMYSEYGLYERLTKLEADFKGANILLHKLGQLPQAFRDIWSNERALNLVEQILDTSDIAGHPVWNLRTKTPRNDATTLPWHQDVAYLDPNSYTVHQVIGWIPLLDSSEENGCMQVIRRGHKTGKVADHECCWAGTWYVMMVEDDIKNKLECDPVEDIVTCPVPYGGMLILNNVVPHRSLNNLSDQIRWSMDFRWQSANDPPCFHGMKDCVRMRSSTDPNMKIDWESFDSIDRHIKALQVLSLTEKDHIQGSDEEFDTRMQAPFMRSWEIVNENRHTANLPPEGSLWINAPVIG